jgi:hypothetical protein
VITFSPLFSSYFPSGCSTVTEAEAPPVATVRPASVTEVTNSENSRPATAPTSIPPPNEESCSEDSDSDSNSEGWVALEDLTLYTSDGNTLFLEEHHLEEDAGNASNRPPPINSISPPQTWRADFDDLKPSFENSSAPFDLNKDQLDAVKVRMQNISLEYKPEWAQVVEESEWRQHLVSRLTRPK